MTRAIEIGIPTKNGIARGLLYTVPHARNGAILIGGGSDLCGPASIYDELALYLHAAGFSTLQMEYLYPHRLTACAYDILGALAALHTWGVEQAVLMIWTSPAEPDATAQDKLNNPFNGDAIGQIVDAIVGLVSVVPGVATIISKPRPRRATASQHAHTHQLRLMRGMPGDPHAPAAPPPRSASAPILHISEDTARRLVLQLGDEADHSRYAAQLFAKLYAWCHAIFYGSEVGYERQPIPLSCQPAMTAPLAHSSHAVSTNNRAADIDTPTKRTGRQTFTASQLWLDQQWRDILASLEARDPARYAQARHLATSLSDDVLGYSRRIASLVWPLLDFEARAEWLQTCSQAHLYIRSLARVESRREAGIAPYARA